MNNLVISNIDFGSFKKFNIADTRFTSLAEMAEAVDHSVKSSSRKSPYAYRKSDEQDIQIQRLLSKVERLTARIAVYEEKEKMWIAAQNATNVATINAASSVDNGFSNEIEIEDIVVEEPQYKNTNPSTSVQGKSSQARSKKDSKIPPIKIFGQSAKQISNKLEALQITKFSMKKISKTHILHAEQLADFQKIRQSLKDENAQHFSYTPAEIKNKTFILRGLDGDEEPTEILDALNALNTTSVQFVSVKKLNTKQPNSLFMVQASASSVEANLTKINKLNHVIIKWEKLQRKDVLQCRRCQRLGHTASNCGMQYRCVKCNSPHDPGQCKLPAGVQHENHEVFCISCNEFGHPASYHGCPQIVRFKQNIATKKQANQRVALEKVQLYNNFTLPNVSFRDALQHSQQPSQQSIQPPNQQPSQQQSQQQRSQQLKPISPPFGAIDPSLVAMLANIVRESLEPIQQQMMVQANHIKEIYRMFSNL